MRATIFRNPVFICLILGWLASTAAAQEKQSENIPELFKRYDSPVGDDIQQQLNLARRLIQTRDFENAAAILEVAQEKHPDNSTIDNMLLNCYDRLEHHLKAELTARKILQKQPSSLGIKLKLAEHLVAQQKNDEGIQIYRSVLNELTGFHEGIYEQVLGNLIQNGLDSLALLIIDSVRIDQNFPLLFASRRGSVLEKRRMYAEAAYEYYSILDMDTTRGAIDAERRLKALLEFPETAKQVESELLRVVREDDNLRVLRILTSHYIDFGEYDRAFELSIHQDSIDQMNGLALIQFIYNCADRKQYPQIVRMGRYVTEHINQSPLLAEINIRFAAALAQTGQYSRAIEVYSELYNSLEDDAGRADMLYQIGMIYLDDLKDYNMALRHFDSVISRHPRGVGYLNSMAAGPICHLRLGEMTEARSALDRQARRLTNDQDKESRLFYLSVIDLAEEAFDSAEVGLQRLVVQFPDGLWVNDAIELMMLLAQTKDKPELRQIIARAVVYEYRVMPDSARDQLMAIVEPEPDSLADLALYRLALLALDEGDTTEALTWTNRLIENYELSYFYPLGLKIKADMMIGQAESVERAFEIYRKILEEYPDYPFATQIRKIIRTENDRPEQVSGESGHS